MKYYRALFRLFIFLCNFSDMSTESTRPNYREDYIFEKTFNSFYKVHQTAMPWSQAKIRCEAEGATLLVPNSLDEADSIPVLIARILHKYVGVFVGMHDMYSERSFVTVHGSKILDSILDLLWEYREPHPGGGHCVAMRRSGQLFVQPCDNLLPFVCKKHASNITYYQKCDTFDPGWKLSPTTGSCYLVHAEPQTWRDAYATCYAAGGYLAILNSRSEADYIRDQFKQISEYRIPDNDFAFLGFSDLFRRHHYRTVHGERLQDVGYMDWDIKCVNPDNIDGLNERCGGVRRSGLLTVANCDSYAIFFCEKSPHDNHTAELSKVAALGGGGGGGGSGGGGGVGGGGGGG